MSLSLAILVVEREPPTLADLPGALQSWLQVAGAFATLALAIWWLAGLLRRRIGVLPGQAPAWQVRLFRLTLGLAVICDAVGGSFVLVEGKQTAEPLAVADTTRKPDVVSAEAGSRQSNANLWFTLGGFWAVIGVGAPFVRDLVRLRLRRIWAIARLSIKEANSRGVPWVLLAMLPVYLFTGWFLTPKPEDQVRSFVQVLYWAVTPLLLGTAGIVAAFSISADVQNQTIYTVVTKPVERFEFILGRFLGYVVLMTGLLVALTMVNLVYVTRGVDPDAAFESLRDRVPLYGQLEFVRDGVRDTRGLAVGREWTYRRYIAGGRESTHRAIWMFRDLPAHLGERPTVPCEFAFDIFRSSRGKDEDKGVGCTLTFQTWNWDPTLEGDYLLERERQKPEPQVLDQLAEKYGVYEVSLKVTDTHVFVVDLPHGLLKNALAPLPPEVTSTRSAPPLLVSLKCEDESQYLGVARHDLYLLDEDSWFEHAFFGINEDWWFGVNFCKGAVGLWFRLCLVIGLAVVLSTYLSGVISWLTAMFLYLAGLFEEYISDLARGVDIGGGPGEAFIRLVSRTPISAKLDPSPTTNVALVLDEGFRGFLRLFVSQVIPDVGHFDWTEHVAEGFDISGGDLFLNAIFLAAYLLPWFVLGYYLLKSREVAS